jgi:hypothetical protein
VVECLPSIHEALCLIPSTTKNKQIEKKEILYIDIQYVCVLKLLQNIQKVKSI